MIRTTAKIICIIFHPLLMATVLFALIAWFAPELIGPANTEFLQLFLLIIFIMTFVIPLISVAVLKFTGTIHTWHMTLREERILPFILITIYYAVSSYLMADKLPVNDIVILILYAISFEILILTIITFFWKISAHAIAIGGVFGFLCALNLTLPDGALLIPTVVVAFLSGFIMSARLYLDEHNPPQVYSGAFIGFFISFSGVLFFV